MRLLFINETHPARPHVAGMRLHQFARALIARGHEVVQVTGPAPAQGSTAPTAEQHPSAPHLIVLPALHLKKSRFSPLRRVQTALRMLYGDRATRAWLNLARNQVLEELGDFRPDLIWATFGNITSLLLAKRLASDFDCPWVIDTKDNWKTFVRRGLRAHVARRFASASGLTANARFHEQVSARYFPDLRRSLIYSGVAEPFYRARPEPLCDVGGQRTLLLVGGIYRRPVLDEFLAAVERWRRTLSAADQLRFRLRYVGGAHEAVAESLQATELANHADVVPFLPLDELARTARDSFCASYLWFPATFHHKLLELLVAGQAVIAFPGEHDESRDLAQQCNTPFAVCQDADELIATLTDLWAAGPQSANRGQESAWRWADFAVGLEQFFETIVASQRATH